MGTEEDELQSLEAGEEVSGDEEEEEDDRTPLDHPLFLPVLLVALSFWFIYDGWFNMDPEMLEHQTFNRAGSVVLILGSILAIRSALREMKAEKAEESGSPDH